MTKVAYITSGKVGIHRFTYNELNELSNNKIDFVLCLSQLKSGPWMPKKEWNSIIATRRSVFISFFNLLIVKPKTFLKLFRESIQSGVFFYFLISLSFWLRLKRAHLTSIHCQIGDRKLYIGYFLKILLNIPLSVTIHSHELYQRDVYDNNLKLRNLFSFCDKVITISEFNKKLLIENFGISTEKLHLIRLFPEINDNEFAKGKTKILIVANWSEKKGYKILFEAIKEMERCDFVVWVVGGTYYSSNSINVADLVQKYGIGDKVALLGRLGGTLLDIVFSACDIFCLPSFTEYYADGEPAEREGIPVALMEAMAWGKPVITTNHAGNSELVNELLVEERDSNGLKKAIEFLLNHPEKWAEYGRKNQKIVADHYSKSNVIKLATIFENFVE